MLSMSDNISFAKQVDAAIAGKHHLAQSYRKIPESHNLSESFERVHKAYSYVEKQFDSTAKEMGISFEKQQKQQMEQAPQDNIQDIDNIAEIANFSAV